MEGMQQSQALPTSSQQLPKLESPERSKPRFFLFGPPSTLGLIEGIVARESASIERGDISWEEFDDGFPNLLIRNIDDIRGRDVVFVADFFFVRDMFSQLSVLYALPRYLVRSMTVILAYFPTATMERIDFEGQIATAHTLAKIFSAIPLTPSGPAKMVIYDIHALQERFYFGENVVPVLATAIPLLLDALRMHHSDERIAIAFPDEGAEKRFARQFPAHPLIVCSKVRHGDKRIVRLKEGDPTGFHVFIVDDLVRTGETLMECKNVLLANGAQRVSAFVTHAIFPRESWKRFAVDERRFATFYITDSCPAVATLLASVAPFRVLSLASSMADVAAHLV